MLISYILTVSFVLTQSCCTLMKVIVYQIDEYFANIALAYFVLECFLAFVWMSCVIT